MSQSLLAAASANHITLQCAQVIPRYMPLESFAPLRDDVLVSMPAVAADQIRPSRRSR